VIGAVPQFAGVPQCLARSPQAAAERSVAAAAGARYLDTGDTLCTPAGGCGIYVDGEMVYRDGAHLSVRGSMVFVPALRDASRPLANGGQAQR
jgi:hypothetical protein